MKAAGSGRTGRAIMALLLPAVITLMAGWQLSRSTGFAPDYRQGRPPLRNALKAPRVQDFASMFNHARFFVANRGASSYSPEAHERFLGEWLGPPHNSALRFGYSPTAVLLLLPLFPLSTPWAWAVWCLLPAAVFVGVWRRLSRGADSRRERLLLLVLASPVFFWTVALGQTALVSTTLLLLMLAVVRARPRGDFTGEVALGACLFALTFKPPLAVVAGIGLAGAGRWRALVGAAIAAAAVAFAATWWSGGWNWAADYLHMVRTYNTVECAPIFRLKSNPATMTNLRGALLCAGAGDDAWCFGVSGTAFAISIVALGAAAVGLAAAGRRPDAGAAFAVGALAFACFCPHLSHTEDLILAILPFCISGGRTASAICVAVVLAALFMGPSTVKFVMATREASPVLCASTIGVFLVKVCALGWAVVWVVRALRAASQSEPSSP